ncbi:MAG: hypothetical protein H6Q48_2371, partial [Deltaproteobacteria bacterium]|nr:hypothetical protein [Deltaproteobacteria bacterium]
MAYTEICGRPSHMGAAASIIMAAGRGSR